MTIRGGLAVWHGRSPGTPVFGGSLRSEPMMQSCVSLAHLRGGGPILNHGGMAMFGVGVLPPRIVVGRERPSLARGL